MRATRVNAAIEPKPDELSIDSIEAAIRARAMVPSFDAELACAYERDTGQHRDGRTAALLSMYGVVTLALLFMEWLFLPSLLLLALQVRLAVFVIAQIGAAVLRHARLPLLRTLASTLPIAFGTAAIAMLAEHAPSPFTDRYLMANGGVIVMFNMMTALRPRDMLIGTGLSLAALNFVMLSGWWPVPRASLVDLAVFTSLLVVCSVAVGLRREGDGRRLFLMRARDGIRTRLLEQANANLTHKSLTDPLTGIANRRAFEAALERAWQQAVSSGDWLAVLMIDVDHFKSFNDRYGHARGDQCLQLVAQALRTGVDDECDCVARYGGEEFAAICPGKDVQHAQALGERMRAAVRELSLSADAEAQPGALTVSIGVAAVAPRSESVHSDDVVRAADSALYGAKRAGRDRVVVAPSLDLDAAHGNAAASASGG